jgi:GT2 family glycosyltransferase
MNQILIITVNYKDTNVTENFVHSLGNLDASDKVKLVVVDSASTPKTKDNLQSLLHSSTLKTQLIVSASNTFYWGGVALALDTLDLNYANGPSWIIVCNNDILFTQQDFLEQLIALDPDKYPVIGPTIYSSVTGKNLNPYMDQPIRRLEKIYLSLFYINYVTARIMQISLKWLKKLLATLKRPSPSKIKKIYAPHGSFVIFSNQYFKRGGWVDSNYEMYGEEVTTAEIAKKNKIPIFFVPELEVIHVIHSSTTSHSWKREFNYAKTAYLYYKNAYF